MITIGLSQMRNEYHDKILHKVFVINKRLEQVYGSSVYKFQDRDYKRKNKNPEKYIDGYYYYIPFDLFNFIEKMDNLTKLYPRFKKFIDVGCGIGDKVLIAKEFFGLDATGIEYSDYTSGVAKRKLKNLGVNIIHDDAFNLDFGEYNYIYLYVPIQNPVKMGELGKHILNSMKEGIYSDVTLGYLGNDFSLESFNLSKINSKEFSYCDTLLKEMKNK